MNFVTKQLVMSIGPMVLESVIESILTEENLIEYRDRAIALIKDQAKKTKTKIDDNLSEVAIEWVMDAGNYIKYTRHFCQILREYVSNSANDYDNMLCLPILDRIERLGTGN